MRRRSLRVVVEAVAVDAFERRRATLMASASGKRRVVDAGMRRVPDGEAARRVDAGEIERGAAAPARASARATTNGTAMQPRHGASSSGDRDGK